MGRTRTQLRQLTVQQSSLPFITGTSTDSSATTLTDLPGLGAFENNFLNGSWLYIPAATVKERRVTDNVQSTGVVTFRPSSGAGILGNPYEFAPWRATDIHLAIEEALFKAYQQNWVRREFFLNHWVTGSPIYNSSFDYWDATATVDGWTAATVTIARTQHTGSTIILPGQSAVTFSGSAGTLGLDTQYQRFLADFRGYAVTLHAIVYSSVGSVIRAQLLADGSLVGSTSHHSGNSTWEVLSKEITLGDGVTQIQPRFDLAGGVSSGTHMAGAIWFEGGPGAQDYPFPVGLAPEGPSAVWVSDSLTVDETNLIASPYRPAGGVPLPTPSVYRYRDEAADTQMGVMHFNDKPVSGRRLWMPSTGPYTIPSADTGIVELEQPEDLLIAKMAALSLLERQQASQSRAWQEKIQNVMGRLQRDITALSETLQTEPGATPLSMDW